MRKTIISAAMATTILVGSATAAFAAPTHYIVGGKAYTINDLTNDGYMANYQEDAKGKTVYITDKDANKTITIADLAGREYSEAIKGGKNRADEITEDVKIVGADLKPGESLEVPGKDEVTALEIISISVINETGFTVTFPEGTEVKDVEDKTITLTAGETAITATYKADSFADNVATFEFTKVEAEKLVDAETYTLSSEGLDFGEENTAVAKILASYAKKINVITAGLPENVKGDFSKNIVNFEIKDQFGDSFTVASNGDLKVTGTVKGIPLTASELELEAKNGTVQIKKNLAEGDKVELTFTNKINDKTEIIGTKSFTVSEKAELVATTISNPVAKYKVAINDHEVGKKADEILADDEITLTVDVRDQFGNKLTGTTDAPVRWVISKGSDLIDNSTNDTSSITNGIADTDETLNFKAVDAGDVVIDAYISNGKKVSYSFTIGAKKLETINAVTFQGDVFNHEAKTSEVVTFTAGAVLKASDLKFHVTSTPEGTTAADLTLEAVQGTEDEANEVKVKATAKKAGEYKFIPYIGENFEEATVKGAESTITSKVRTDVASISDFKFDAKELKKDAKNIKAEIVFKNKHGEVLNKEQAAAEVVSSKAGVTGDVTIVQGTEENKDKTYVNLAKLGKGTASVTVQADGEVKTLVVTVGESVLATIDAGSNVTGVVAGDSTVSELAKYNDIKFLDQDGIDLGEQDATVAVRKSGATEDLTADAANKIVKLGTITYKEDGTVNSFNADGDSKYNAIKIHPEAAVEKGTYTVTVSQDITVDEKTKTISDSFTINVGEARKLDKLTVTPVSGSAVVGAKSNFKLSGLDQYGKKFVIAETNVKAEGEDVTLTASEAVDGEVPFTLQSNKAGNYNVVVFIGEGETKAAGDKSVTVPFNVGELGDVISSVKVQPEVTVGSDKYDTSNYKVKVTKATSATNLEFSAKAFDANESEVNAGDNIVWSVVDNSIVVAGEGNSASATFTGSKLAITPSASAEVSGSVTVRATSLNGKTDDMVVNVSSKTAEAQAGTYQLATTADGTKDVDGKDVSTVIESVVLDEKSENVIDGVKEVHLIAEDQYGQVFDVTEANATVGFDSSIASATKNSKIDVKAERAGSTTMTILIGNETLRIPVEVKQTAVDAAKLKADQAIVDGDKSKFTGPFADVAAIKAVNVSAGVTISVNVTKAATTQATGTATVTLTKGKAATTVEDVVLSKVAVLPTGVAGTASQTKNGVDKVTAEAAVVELTINNQATAAGDVEIKLGSEVIGTITVEDSTTIEQVVDLIVAETFTDFDVEKSGTTKVVFTAKEEKKQENLSITIADKE